MFDPELPKFREEYDRLGRKKLWAIPVAVGVWIIWIVALTMIPGFEQALDSFWVFQLPLIGFAGYFLYLEYRRFQLFRADLRERTDRE